MGKVRQVWRVQFSLDEFGSLGMMVWGEGEESGEMRMMVWVKEARSQVR